jgi:hypothetical protein
MTSERLINLSGPEANQTERKVLGVFYTDGVSAELLAQLTVRDAHDRTLDLACGDGVLLTAAYRTKRSLLTTRSGTNQSQTRLLKELFGVDIARSAARLAAARLLLESAPPKYDPVNVAVSDSTTLLPGKILPALGLHSTVIGGNRQKQSRGNFLFHIDVADVVLMNPPFTRIENLSTEFKQKLRKHFSRYSEYHAGRLGLYGYFVFLADMFVKKGGSIGIVLPASFLRLTSTSGPRRLLFQNYDITYLIVTLERPAFSESSSFREIMVVGTKRRSVDEKEGILPSEKSHCLVVHLEKDLKTWEDAHCVAEQIRQLSRSDKKTFRNPGLFATKIPHDMLNSNLDNLYRLVSITDHRTTMTWSTLKSCSGGKLIRLGDYLQKSDSKILRGLETRVDIGKRVQDVFVLRNGTRARGERDQWILDKKMDNFLICRNTRTEERIRVSLSSLKPGLRRLSGLGHIDASDDTDWVFYGSYRARSLTSRQRALQARWRSYVKDRVGTLVIARRFGITRRGTRLLAFCCKQPVAPSGVMWVLKNLHPHEAMILALWFNSSANMLQLLLNRVETSGAWMQLHEYVLKDLLILDPKKISKRQTELLVKTYNRMKTIVFPSLSEQFYSHSRARLVLDDAILRCLGLDKRKAESIARQARLAVMHEFRNLSRIDAGNNRYEKVLWSEGLRA